MAASELTAQMDALLERYAIGLHTEWRARGRQPPPPAATNCISGDGGKWLLAVGTSPLRLFTVGLAARLVGEEAMASASTRVLIRRACQASVGSTMVHVHLMFSQQPLRPQRV